MTQAILRLAQFVTPRTSIQACRDPKDNHVLACALDGRAEFLVTGDRDRLALDPFQGIRIVTARAFFKLSPFPA